MILRAYKTVSGKGSFDSVYSRPVIPFRLDLTLDSGQFFRWRPDGDGFVVTTHGRTFFARQAEDLEIRGVPRDFAERFFALDHDLAAIRASLARDAKLRPAIEACPGLRLLRQEPWECLLSFVTSAACNIPRIRRNLSALCGEGATPRPAAMPDERTLRRLGFGFRAKHIVPLAREVERGALRGLEALTTGEARARLCDLPGVGVKVADCVLLFAYERLEAFPVDVWIRRIMRRFVRGGDRAVREHAAKRWGPLAGYAQQFLYVWSRR